MALMWMSSTLLFAQNGRSWIIEGDVKDSSGGHVEGADVTVAGPERLPPVAADAAGHFVLKGRVSGRYLISVSKERAAPKSRSVSISPGAHLESIDFQLNKQAVINGRVLSAEREPVEGALVIAWIKTFRNGRLALVNAGDANTNDLGAYRINGLAEGRYYLGVVPKVLVPRKRLPAPATKARAMERFTSPLRSAFYPNAPSFEGAAPVTLRAGGEFEGTDILLGGGESFCVSATVAAPLEVPVAEVVLQLFARIGGAFPLVANGQVSPGEESEVCKLTAGEYTALATSWDPQTKMAAGFFRMDLVVGKRDVALGTLHLVPGLPLRGRIVIEPAAAQDDGLPGQISVELRRWGRPLVYGEGLRASVEPSGTFAVTNVFPDSYGLDVDGLPDGYYVRAAVQQGRDVRRGPVRLDQGDLSVSLGRDGGAASGETVDQNKDPVYDAAVIMVPKDAADGLVVFSAQSDQNGRFEFKSVPPGDYRLAAFTGLFEGEEQDPEFIRAHLSGAVDISITPNGSRSVTAAVNRVR